MAAAAAVAAAVAPAVAAALAVSLTSFHLLQLAAFPTSCCRERVEMSFNLTMYQPHLQGERLRLRISGKQSWPPLACLLLEAAGLL